MTVTTSAIQEGLASISLTTLDCTADKLGALQVAEDSAGAINITMRCGFPVNLLDETDKNRMVAQCQAVFPDRNVQLTFAQKIVPHETQPNVGPIAQVKNCIAIASGKGGVGKSTTCVNLALALAAAGARVGILDADIYGPNQPQMLGVDAPPDVQQDKRLKPVIRYGLQTISFGYLVAKETPMVWRGPMVSSALQQLATLTLWDDLDYLLIDMPPGTGDIQLTLAKKVPVTGAVVVTTPQDIALLDARKGFEMFRKVDIPVLGIIENMSTHTCSQCGHTEAIFGEQGGADMASACGVPLLAKLPLSMPIRQACDAGCPIVAAAPESDCAEIYRRAAAKIAFSVSARPRSYAHNLPPVVVE